MDISEEAAITYEQRIVGPVHKHRMSANGRHLTRTAYAQGLAANC